VRDVALGVLSLTEAEDELDTALDTTAGLLGGPDPGLDLILRRDQIWWKPSALPESVRDRCHTAHEYWFHLVKQGAYYTALDELRKPTKPRAWQTWADRRSAGQPERQVEQRDTFGAGMAPDLLGRAPGSVWSIPSEPLHMPAHLDTDHHAAFPTEWPRRLILGWSPLGICTECQHGRFPVVDRQTDISERPNRSAFDAGPSIREVTEATILGYACACTPFTDHPERRQPTRTPQLPEDPLRHTQAPTGHRNTLPAREPVREYHLNRWTPPPTRPAVVLDPFGGTGTTAHVAHALGRVGVSVDLSVDYCRLAADQSLAAQRAGKVHSRTNRERQLTFGFEEIA
jgi:hypothetical protein